MYAIIKVAGQQFKVEEGKVIEVNRLNAQEGEVINLTDCVLMVSNDGEMTVGTPTIAGATVEVEVKEHFRGPKLIVFKFKRRHRYHRKNGHRQDMTRLVVKAIKA